MRPIDMQISIPRTAEVGRVAQGDQQQNQMRQQEVINQSQAHTDHYENTVRHSEHADAKKVKDQKEREKKQQQDKKHAQEPEEEKKELPSMITSVKSRGKLDILA